MKISMEWMEWNMEWNGMEFRWKHGLALTTTILEMTPRLVH